MRPARRDTGELLDDGDGRRELDDHLPRHLRTGELGSIDRRRVNGGFSMFVHSNKGDPMIDGVCMVAPSPEVYAQLRKDLKKLAPQLASLSDTKARELLAQELAVPAFTATHRVGFNDGRFYPP